jgi:hypothetical protein
MQIMHQSNYKQMIKIISNTHFKVFIILSGLLLCTTLLFSQDKKNTRIYGTVPEYKNHTIAFEYYQNFLNFEQNELFRINIDDEGKFEFSHPLDCTTYA